MNEALAITSVDIGGQFHGSLLGMILDAGTMVQVVLFLLLFFSVVSWAIILMKYRILRKTKKENEVFLETYMKSNNLSEIFFAARKFRYSTIAEVFRSGYAEFSKVSGLKGEFTAGAERAEDNELSPDFRGIDSVERALNRACNSEIAKQESALVFLATTGSASPFIGLFGTVWGIMNAFRGIGVKGTATLAVVAPGISEALIATAAGLLAAIPAVVFYNYFTNKVKFISVETDSFASEFLNIVERYFAKSTQL